MGSILLARIWCGTAACLRARASYASAPLACALLLAGAAGAAETGEHWSAYTGATLISGDAAPTRGMAVVVRGERIERVVPEAELELPEGAERIDATGQYLVPGLIDSHVHLATPPDRKWALAQLERDLQGGVTTVRSMADDARAVAELARAARVGEIPSPDIQYAALFAGPGFFHDERLQASAQGETAGQVPWQREIVPGTDLAEAVTLARGAGASAIKIYANLDAATVGRIVREAHRQGLRAWAHGAVFPASPLDLAEAGVDTLSHVCMLAYQGQDMPRAYHARASVDERRFERGMPAEVTKVFESMKRHGVVLDATSFVYTTIERMRAEMPEGQGPPTYCSAALAERVAKAAFEAGVAFSVGTDATAPPDDAYPALQSELELLVAKSGLSPAAALRAATFGGALALGREREIGTIEPGKLANLVLLGSDPTADVGAFRDVRSVTKRGRRYRRADYVPPGRSALDHAPD